VGSKKNPIWRVGVADQRSPRDGRFIETIGHYNPQTAPSTIVIDRERFDHWVARGAQPSGTVKQLVKAQSKAPPPAPVAEAPVEPVAEEPVAAAETAVEEPAVAAETAAEEPAADAEPAAEVEPEPAAEAEAEPAAEAAADASEPEEAPAS
jgi:small subunit ribosomal protein S16